MALAQAVATVAHSNGEISAQLFISEATTRTHVAHIVSKAGSRDRTQAVVPAYQAGMMRGS
ncbi:response regulator transcription factor [Nocardia farcinica]|uniref:LuxR C-terminal-related transcriptional regulator n=1 Tax=Nocardia TaxID=1817 RepID=UPI001895104F|nr:MULTISPECIES: LuxR C-terminal-related transcriptional regulator [Nocardia]MBF6289969.1 response regulator transcription factor [Nocardia cyriacigeorgica]MBF6422265.1 response regulator transcription factor [Nocardia farcinica]MBF6433921.1 response regulator transcription factor [Nocardia farcinica]MBF6504989.1 response regulator transcription factor [Nocardia farcinica]